MCITDSLSCYQMQRFRTLAPQGNLYQVPCVHHSVTRSGVKGTLGSFTQPINSQDIIYQPYCVFKTLIWLWMVLIFINMVCLSYKNQTLVIMLRIVNWCYSRNMTLLNYIFLAFARVSFWWRNLQTMNRVPEQEEVNREANCSSDRNWLTNY